MCYKLQDTLQLTSQMGNNKCHSICSTLWGTFEPFKWSQNIVRLTKNTLVIFIILLSFPEQQHTLYWSTLGNNISNEWLTSSWLSITQQVYHINQWTYVQDLFVCFRWCGFSQNLDGHRDLHIFPLWNPQALHGHKTVILHATVTPESSREYMCTYADGSSMIINVDMYCM